MRNEIFEAVTNLKMQGNQPTRIELCIESCKILMEECMITPEDDWEPKDGDEVGRFMDVPIFINEQEQLFTVIGARK